MAHDNTLDKAVSLEEMDRIFSAEFLKEKRAEFLKSLPDITDQCPYAQGNSALEQGLVVHVMSGDISVCSLPVALNQQHMGIMHGGANALLGETAGSFAASTLAAPEGFALGLDIEVHHHRPAASGRVYCSARLVSRTRTLASYRLTFFRSDGKVSASGTHTCALRKK